MNKRRLLKRLGILVGTVIALLAALYLARRPLLESTIVDRVEAMLASMLDAEVDIGSIGGNWITELSIEDIELRGHDGSAYEEVLGLDIALRYSLIDLCLGDLTGLQWTKIHADRIALNCEGAWSRQSLITAGPSDQKTGWRSFTDLLAEGGEIKIDELALTPDYLAPGPCMLKLSPGNDRRDISLALVGDATTKNYCIIKLRGNRLIAPEIAIDLPGITVSVNDLDIPLALLSAETLREVLQHKMSGQLHATITDHDRSLVPITGALSLDLGENAAGLLIRDLVVNDYRSAKIAMRANLEGSVLAVTEFTIDQPTYKDQAIAERAYGKVMLAGTWTDPDPRLDITLDGASYKFPSLPRIEELSARLIADRAACKLTGTGSLGASPVTLSGTWTASSRSLVEGYLEGQIDARIRGDDVLLMRTGGLKLRGDVDLTATGSLDKILVQGRVGLANSKYVKRLSLVPDLKLKSGTSSPDLFGPWTFPGGERFDFDIKLETNEPIAVATNIVDTEFDLSCKLVSRGNNLHLEGACVSRTGKLRLPGIGMDLHSLRLVFSKANPTRPDMFASASGQRHGIRIKLQASGPWDDPVVNLSSTPPLAPKALWALVTTGIRPNTLAQNDAQANTAILATYILQEMLLTYFASESTEAGDSFVSRFTFEVGNEISRDGEETWQVNFDIGDLWIMPPNFGIRVERDVYEDLNMGLVYRWRF